VSRVSPYLPSFIGGALCLDFVNTVDPRHADERDDLLRSYVDLVRWSERAEAVSSTETRELVRLSKANAKAAAAVLRRAVDLREALYRLFASSPGEVHTRHEDLARLNDEFHRAVAMADLAPGNGGWQWQWRPEPELDRVLWPISRSASELLSSDQTGRIRECEGSNGCGWLFLDTSKNGRRRWCDMQVCGNRAKAQRHRQRVKERTRAA
jgi:predicted RNA-binding Zn ribbon-like protein